MNLRPSFPPPPPVRPVPPKRSKPKKTRKRFVWAQHNVSSTKLHKLMLRTYLEWDQLHDLLSTLDLETACEVGCGFGRMTIELSNVARVWAFEREPKLVEAAKEILPSVVIHRVPTLTKLPLADGQVQLAMTFTVLQHMSDEESTRVIEEMKRISSRYILLVEETDPGHHYVDPRDGTHFTHGRSVEAYERLLEPFLLVRSAPRLVEPSFKYQGHSRPFVGHFMLFERPND